MRLIIAFMAMVFAMSPAFSAEKIKLALNWKPEPQFGGFYAAEVAGHYKKKGLNVEVVPGGAGTPVIQMVGGGQIDYGIVAGDELVISRSRGSDVVALFAVYQTNPQGIMVHEERGFKSMAEVFATEGTVALQKGLPYEMYLKKTFGQPKAKVVPYLGGIANFMSDKKHSQQCFVTSEPLAARKRGLKVKTFMLADVGYNPYTTVLITRREVYEKNPAQVKALVEAVRAGWRTYLDSPADTIKLMANLNKSMDIQTFNESSEAQKSLIETEETKKLGLGSMTTERWKTLSEQLVDLNLVKSAPDPNSLFLNL